MALARWKIMDKILWISLGLLVLFAWVDSQNLIGIKQIDAQWQNPALWDIFWEVISPAIFFLWMGVLLAIALIWYLYSKDKSESIALFTTPALLIYFGAQDLIYYVFSPDTLVTSMGCWANKMPAVKFISGLMGETCPSPVAFIISALVGIVLAYLLYKWLQKQTW